MTTVTEPTLFDAIPSAPVDDATASLLALVSGDRIHADDARTVVEAIRRTAAANAGTVDPNRLCIVHPPVIGALVPQRRDGRALEPTGWVVTEGSTSGNNGRPARTYRLRVAS